MREAWTWSQQALADAVGANRQAINRIEREHAKAPPADLVLRLADVLGVTTDALLRDDLEIPAAAYPNGRRP